MSRRTARVFTAVAAVLVTSLAALSGTTASAAWLDIDARTGVAGAAERCTSSALTVTPTTSGETTSLTITGLDSADLASCENRTATVWIVESSGNVRELTNVALGTSMTTDVSVATTDVEGVMVDIGGFALPTTWRPPVVPTESTCKVVGAEGWTCSLSFFPAAWHGESWAPEVLWATGFIHAVVRGPDGEYQPPPGAEVQFDFTWPEGPSSMPPLNWGAGVVTSVEGRDGVVATVDCGSLPRVSGRISNPLHYSEVQFRVTFDGSGAQSPGCRA